MYRLKKPVKSVQPVQIADIAIVDHAKTKQAITAASFGNAIEWFDFGVYGFVAFALGKVFSPMQRLPLRLLPLWRRFLCRFCFVH